MHLLRSPWRDALQCLVSVPRSHIILALPQSVVGALLGVHESVASKSPTCVIYWIWGKPERTSDGQAKYPSIPKTQLLSNDDDTLHHHDTEDPAEPVAYSSRRRCKEYSPMKAACWCAACPRTHMDTPSGVVAWLNRCGGV